jgi:hypothetical protein
MSDQPSPASCTIGDWAPPILSFKCTSDPGSSTQRQRLRKAARPAWRRGYGRRRWLAWCPVGSCPYTCCRPALCAPSGYKPCTLDAPSLLQRASGRPASTKHDGSSRPSLTCGARSLVRPKHWTYGALEEYDCYHPKHGHMGCGSGAGSGRPWQDATQRRRLVEESKSKRGSLAGQAGNNFSRATG